MQMIATRELAAHPGKIMKFIEKEGGLVVTKDGKPRAIMLPTSDVTLLADMQEIVFIRAKRGLFESQQKAHQTGVHALRMDEIDAEIREVRKERKRG